ncbi:MAG: hypothetical protein KF795_33675 [Labilithrix sp.]|nr:hypothetical protein [Labilithrix sp.]
MTRWAAYASIALAIAGCDFGTLDDLSQDKASSGTSETSTQSLALWKAYDKPDDDVKKAVAEIAGVVERAGGRPVQVTIDDLTKDDLGVPSITRDPTACQGMLVITELDCSLAQIEKLAVAKNQADIYPGSYDKYKRTYQTNIQDFVSGSAPTVTWKTEYTVSLLGRTYEAVLTGGARRVAGAAPGGGAMLVSRTVLDEPARFVAGGDAEFNQDYQLEAFYEIAPSRVVHYYALWREFRVGSLTSSDNLYINVILGNLVDFDVRTSKVCRDNTPLPAFE